MALPEIDAWRVEAIRFTFFYSEPQSGRGKDWWKAVTGADPETTVNKQQTGEYVESGPYLQGHFELKVAFNRVDWMLTYPLASMPDFVQEIDFLDTVDALKKAVGRVTIDSAIVRAAFGVVTLLPVEDIKKGNDVLSEYLPFLNIDANVVEDVFLQINLPYQARTVHSMKVNNVAKWAVLSGQFMQVAVGGLPQVATKYLVRGEIDLSTPAESAPLPAEIVSPLLEEFKGKTIEMLQKGVS